MSNQGQPADEVEPVFVLRAQDQLAAEIVREWAYRAKKTGVPAGKIAAARKIADEMDDWAVEHGRKRAD